MRKFQQGTPSIIKRGLPQQKSLDIFPVDKRVRKYIDPFVAQYFPTVAITLVVVKKRGLWCAARRWVAVLDAFVVLHIGTGQADGLLFKKARLPEVEVFLIDGIFKIS